MNLLTQPPKEHHRAGNRKPKLYAGHVADTLAPSHTDALAIFRDAVARAPLHPAVHYFDRSLSYDEVDIQSDALAVALAERGVRRGDRVALFLQNVPYFPIGMIAAWKVGAVVVPVNPMNRERELGLLLEDSRPSALICHDTLYRDVILRLGVEGAERVPEVVLTTSPLDLQDRNDARLFAGMGPVSCADADDLGAIIASYRGLAPPATPILPDDIAFLVYTSGTTGLPTGAMNTHAKVAYNAQVYREWISLEDGVGVLGVAPLFHITGLVGHLLAAIITASAVTLTYRFDAGVMLDAATERRPGFTVAAITALMAMMNHSSATASQLESLAKIYSGGAPIPPAVVEAFAAKFGHYVHNIYGLTETSSPTHATPLGVQAPVDPASGALSVGVPVPGANVWIAADDGSPAPIGEPHGDALAGIRREPEQIGQPQRHHLAQQGRDRTGVIAELAHLIADGRKVGRLAQPGRDRSQVFRAILVPMEIHVIDAGRGIAREQGFDACEFRANERIVAKHRTERSAAVGNVAANDQAMVQFRRKGIGGKAVGSLTLTGQPQMVPIGQLDAHRSQTAVTDTIAPGVRDLNRVGELMQIFSRRPAPEILAILLVLDGHQLRLRSVQIAREGRFEGRVIGHRSRPGATVPRVEICELDIERETCCFRRPNSFQLCSIRTEDGHTQPLIVNAELPAQRDSGRSAVKDSNPRGCRRARETRRQEQQRNRRNTRLKPTHDRLVAHHW